MAPGAKRPCMTEDLDRISLTLPPEMTDRLDDIATDWDYASRSEAVRDALRDFFTAYEWESDHGETHYGTLVVIHDHHVDGLADRLQQLQHDAEEIITAVQHVHLSHHRCMETITVEGPGAEISDLANRLRSVKGVRQVKVVVVGE